MDIWSWIIVSTIAIIAILSVIDNSTQKRKVNEKLMTLYALIYQTKEYTKFMADFHDHIGQIKNQLPQINEMELLKINISLLRKSMALATVACSRTEKTFDFLKNSSLTKIEMSREDNELIENILKNSYGDDHYNYNIDLDDDSLNSIKNILEVETNRIETEDS